MKIDKQHEQHGIKRAVVHQRPKALACVAHGLARRCLQPQCWDQGQKPAGCMGHIRNRRPSVRWHHAPAGKLDNLPDSDELLPLGVDFQAAQKVIVVHDNVDGGVEEQSNLWTSSERWYIA